MNVQNKGLNLLYQNVILIMNRYFRKQKLNKNDMIKIGLIPYEDQIEIFKQRAMNDVVKQNLENYSKSKIQ
jgi:hypothetical protein